MGLVSWFILIPFATAMVVVATPSSRWYWIRWIALAGTGTLLVLSGVLAWRYWQLAMPEVDTMRDALFTKIYLVERVPWFESLGIQYFVGVDGISVSMVILTAIIIECLQLDPIHSFFGIDMANRVDT